MSQEVRSGLGWGGICSLVYEDCWVVWVLYLYNLCNGIWKTHLYLLYVLSWGILLTSQKQRASARVRVRAYVFRGSGVVLSLLFVVVVTFRICAKAMCRWPQFHTRLHIYTWSAAYTLVATYKYTYTCIYARTYIYAFTFSFPFRCCCCCCRCRLFVNLFFELTMGFVCRTRTYVVVVVVYRLVQSLILVMVVVFVRINTLISQIQRYFFRFHSIRFDLDCFVLFLLLFYQPASKYLYERTHPL